MEQATNATCDTALAAVPSTRPGRDALLIAHPGHELAVHGWLERARPQVFVLTDGSGRGRSARVDSTSKVLHAAGATRGSLYGRMPEHAVYRALFDRDTAVFTALAEELAEALIQGGFDRVYGDMAEGFNPVHDTWRLIVNAAVAIVKRKTGKTLENYEFSLFRRQDGFERAGQRGSRVELGLEAFARKLSVARSYPELAPEVLAATQGTLDDPVLSHPELRERVRVLLGDLGLDAFRVEYFRKLPSGPQRRRAARSDPPFYETYGEFLVAAGRYREALRQEAHLAPVAAALRRLAAGRHITPHLAAGAP